MELRKTVRLDLSYEDQLEIVRVFSLTYPKTAKALALMSEAELRRIHCPLGTNCRYHPEMAVGDSACRDLKCFYGKPTEEQLHEKRKET